MHDPALWIALRDVPGLRPTQVRELLARFGTPAEIFDRRPDELAESCPLEVAVRLSRRMDLTEARREAERAAALGLVPLLQGVPGFPELLLEIEDPPVLLWCRGRLPPGPTLSVVGSRRPTDRGSRLAGELLAQAVAAGAVVVSGLAYGIDAAAHRGALAGGGVTVAVLASGLDRPTPAGNRGLARRILSGGGALLSEYGPGRPSLPQHFHARNRLISGLARATVVIEARERSGSLITARHALEQGRDLWVVPGPIDIPHCRGSNGLLRGPAGVVLDAGDLLESVVPGARAASARPSSEALPPEQRRVLEYLGQVGVADPDSLARRLGMSGGQLARTLLEMELAGRVARSGSRISARAR